MRVYKPKYTKAIPEGSEILVPKKGEYKDIKITRFRDTKGKTQTFPLTQKGDRLLCETNQVLYESSHISMLYKDDIVDFKDYAVVADQWFDDPVQTIDLLAELASAWLEENNIMLGR